jgi:hypothetical protein
MATPETAAPERPAEERELAGINADYKEKFGFHDSETGYAYKSPKGLSREVVESISDTGRAAVDAGLPDRPWHFESADPAVGGNLNQINFDASLLSSRPGRTAARSEVPGTSRTPSTALTSRPSVSSLPESARNTSPRSSTTR